MPRQRIVFCDCLDCVTQPATTDIPSASSPANEAAARQEPPPKCLLFVLSGVLLPARPPTGDEQLAAGAAATELDGCSLPHLNRAVAQGNLCLLTLRDEEEGSVAVADAGCSELRQLLSFPAGTPPVTLADRFKGMVASFSSNSSAARELAAAVGMSSSSVLPAAQGAAGDGDDDDGLGSGRGLDPQLTAAGRGRHHKPAAAGDGGDGVVAGRGGGGSGGTDEAASQQQQLLPDPADAARQILQELGLQHAEAGLDLLAVHLDLPTFLQQQPAASAAASTTAAAAVLAWVDKTLRYLNNSSAFKDAVLLTVLATPGSSTQPAPIPMLAATAGGTEMVESRAGQQLAVLRPMQSWEQLEGQPLAVSRQRAVLCLRRLPGVIRRDACTRFSLSDCCRNSGGLALLVDRLLPEVAYKLGRAPKYGA